MTAVGPRVLVSCPFVSPWIDNDLPAGWSVSPRASDLRVSRWRALAARLTGAARLARESRDYDVLVVSTASTDLMLAVLARPFMGRRKLVAYDPLQSGNTRIRAAALGWFARRLDLVICIRRTDLELWSAARQVAFAPFIAPAVPEHPLAASNDPVAVYAAGQVHRDYPLLMEALAGIDVEATVSTSGEVDTLGNDRVAVREPVSPETGRALQQKSGISAVMLRDTSLPAGPLVLLDAMAAGAAVVCTNSGGLVDYVEHGVDALVLSRPHDPEELAGYLQRLAADKPFRESLGRAARAKIAGPLSAAAAIGECERLVSDLVTPRR